MRKIKLIAILLFSIVLLYSCVSTTGTTNLSNVSDELFIEDEYYIGKGVAGLILKDYKILDNDEANEYFRFIGLTISSETNVNDDVYKMYSFALLDTDERIAYTTPSGFTFISKGLMKDCENEDEFAGIIAHLIGLNINKEVINMIPKELKQKINYAFEKRNEKLLNEAFIEVINSAYNSIKTGYSDEAHLKADKEAVRMLFKIGYSIDAYESVVAKLTIIEKDNTTEAVNFLGRRIEVIKNELAQYGKSPQISTERTKRFKEILSKIK